MAFYRTFCALALVLLPGLLGAATNAVEGASAVTEDADAAEKDRSSTDAGFERYRTIIDRKPFGSTPLHALVFTFPSELRPTTERSLWRDKIVRSKGMRFEVFAAEYDWEAMLLQGCFPFLEKLTLNRSSRRAA